MKPSRFGAGRDQISPNNAALLLRATYAERKLLVRQAQPGGTDVSHSTD